MKKLLAKTSALTKEEWFSLRLKGIGGSDAAAACGLSRYVSPYTLYLEKTGVIHRKESGEAAYWGHVMEPVLRAEFTKRTHLETTAVPYMFYDESYPWMLANIDGIVKQPDGSVSLLEIKTAGYFAAADWKDGMPPEYYIQIQHYLSVLSLRHAYVAVLLNGNEFRIIEAERNKEAISHIIELETTFWTEYVMKHTAPPVDGSDSTSAALSSQFPQGNHTNKILQAETDDLVLQYVSIQASEKELKTKKTELENQLKAQLGESECAMTPGGYTISWKNYTTKRFDSKRFKEDHPELADSYIQLTESRKFTVKAPKAKKEAD